MTHEEVSALLDVFGQVCGPPPWGRTWALQTLRNKGFIQGRDEFTCTPKGSQLCQAIFTLARGAEVEA